MFVLCSTLLIGRARLRFALYFFVLLFAVAYSILTLYTCRKMKLVFMDINKLAMNRCHVWFHLFDAQTGDSVPRSPARDRRAQALRDWSESQNLLFSIGRREVIGIPIPSFLDSQTGSKWLFLRSDIFCGSTECRALCVSRITSI